jgi:hypothetical protein
MDVEFLFLDTLFGTADGDDRAVRIQKDDVPYPSRDLTTYVRHPVFETIPNSWGLLQKVFQRASLDNVSPRIGYDISRYLVDADPDLFVSHTDQAPFIRHLIYESHGRDFETATIQHGMYEHDLTLENFEGNLFYPNLSPQFESIERLKRRLGFRFGISQYSHPYSDILFTMGAFFTDRIGYFRRQHTVDGKTDIVTSGSPEYPGPVEQYDPDVESVLFLSQHKYEGGIWDQDQQNRIIELLRELDDTHPLTVRPHPKESREKFDNLAPDLTLSETDNLTDDVARHDAVVTVDSTALFEGVIQGKVCATLHPPWEPKTFEPLVHTHILQLGSNEMNLDRRGDERSRETQREYLEEFCYVPSEDEGTAAETPTEFISEYLLERR